MIIPIRILAWTLLTFILVRLDAVVRSSRHFFLPLSPLLFVQGPLNLMNEGYEKLGEVFTVPVLHKRITFLLSPTVVEHFFKGTDEEVSQQEVYGFSVPIFGKKVCRTTPCAWIHHGAALSTLV